VLTKHTQTVPTTKVTITYACDVPGCGFSAEKKSQVVEHFGEKHAVRDRKWIGGQEFARIEDQEAFDAWKTHHGKRSRANVWDCDWLGPGWYGISFGTQRCPRDCCDDHVMTIRHVDALLEERRSEFQEMSEALAELGALTALRRNAERPPERRVPFDTMSRMARQLDEDMPCLSEGFWRVSRTSTG